MLKLLLRRKGNASGGADWYALVAKDEALVGMRDNQFRTADACRVWFAELEYAGLAENLAVAATVAKLRLDRRVPGNLLPRSEQPLAFFRCILFLLRRFDLRRYSFRFLPRIDGTNGRLFFFLHRARLERETQGTDKPHGAAVA